MKKLTALKTDSDPKIESILPLDPDHKIELILANIEWICKNGIERMGIELNRCTYGIGQI